MVFWELSISADLENLTDLQPAGGCDDANYHYCFQVKCGFCGEISEKATWASLSETVPLRTGRGTANLVQKCKDCGRDGSIQLVPGTGSPLTHERSQAEQSAKLMVFDCRGFDPVNFCFGNGWKAVSKYGTPFEIDLSDGEFAEYDEKGEVPVSVSKLKATFKVVRKLENYRGTHYA